jgi:transposase InsO family protein
VNTHKNARLAPAGREQLVKRVLLEKEPVRQVARGMRVSERTVRKWVTRFQAQGVAGLIDRSSRPARSPGRLSLKVVKRIEQLRHRRWTATRIAEALKLAVSTVSLWLRRLGLGRLRSLEPKRIVVRYERERPGELLHLDTKMLGRIRGIGHRIHGDRGDRVRGIGWEYLHVCVDDATRVAYAEMQPDESPATAAAFLQRAVGWFRDQDVWVERVMTDNGNPYRSHCFRRALETIGARHIRTRSYRPQTNGKAERFIQTALRDWAYRAAYRSSCARTAALPGFLKRYNCRRPHRSLGNQTPLSRLERLLGNNVLIANS